MLLVSSRGRTKTENQRDPVADGDIRALSNNGFYRYAQRICIHNVISMNSFNDWVSEDLITTMQYREICQYRCRMMSMHCKYMKCCSSRWLQDCCSSVPAECCYICFHSCIMHTCCNGDPDDDDWNCAYALGRVACSPCVLLTQIPFVFCVPWIYLLKCFEQPE